MQAEIPSDMRIRRWTPADARTCLAIFRAAIMAGRGYTRAQRRDWSSIPYSFRRWRLRQSRYLTLVAIADGRIAGFTEFRRDGHVHMLFVDPDFMRLGLARELLEAGDAAMAARGVIRRDTWASRSSAPVFARAGYRTLGLVAKPAGSERLLTRRMARPRL
ncbi:MAG: GNAT family N-acetyltransferase [Minwuia sp.]|uniref:GNAT family N-acetyltransferase n=1 Tax=Minwuia sp. TaxID=2493630 RepID=UPI003A8B06BC